jgi:hypothetical protein
MYVGGEHGKVFNIVKKRMMHKEVLVEDRFERML